MKKLLLISNQYTLLDEIAASFSKSFQVSISGFETSELKMKIRDDCLEMIVINTKKMSNAQYLIINDIMDNLVDTQSPIAIIGSEEDRDVINRLLKIAKYEDCLGMSLEACIAHLMKRLQKKKIMLVDDDAMMLRNMNQILKGKYEVLMAPSGILAMTLLGKTVPDLILLDYEMPICDGPQTLAMIRGEETYKDIPVIFLTGVNDKEKIVKVLEYKPQGYLLKSLPSEEIVAKIDDFFGKVDN